VSIREPGDLPAQAKPNAAGGAAGDTTMTTGLSAVAATAGKSRSEVATAAIVALVAGLGLLFTMGFAHPELLHNAAHDWRHSMSFPCH
jgi:cobalt transporter subunit CbtB